MTCDGKYFYHQLAVRWSRQGLAGEIIWLLGNIGASWLGQSSSTTSTRRGAGNIYIPLTTSLYYHNFLPSYHPHTITTTLMTTRFRNINQPSWGLIRKIHKMKKANQPMVGLYWMYIDVWRRENKCCWWLQVMVVVVVLTQHRPPASAGLHKFSLSLLAPRTSRPGQTGPEQIFPNGKCDDLPVTRIITRVL